MSSECSESSSKLQLQSEVSKVQVCDTSKKCMGLMFQESTCKFREDSQKSRPQNTVTRKDPSQYTRDCSTEKRKFLEHSQELMDQQWCDISEVIESDFLIAPGDIYPNRKVELEDAAIKNST